MCFGSIRTIGVIMIDVSTEVDLENMQLFGNVEGKNSSVYLANDRQLRHQFVVKKIKKSDIYNDYESTEEKNLFNESSILYKVAHPNISEIQYASFDDDFVYIVMPYYQNGSIQSILDERNLSMREFIKYSLEFLSGLLFVHANSLVHFDIKPTNILINNNGKAVLTDFGLAKYLDNGSELAVPNKIYNSHIPPEIFESNELSRQSDIYQAGVTMYRMANGNAIWNEQLVNCVKDKIISGVFPSRETYLPHVLKKITKIINKCMNPDVNKRYQSVLDIINDLSEISGELDWYYTKTSEKEEVWKKEVGNMEMCIKITNLGNCYDLETMKTNLQTNRTSKVSAMCKKCQSPKEAYQIIKKQIQ